MSIAEESIATEESTDEAFETDEQDATEDGIVDASLYPCHVLERFRWRDAPDEEETDKDLDTRHANVLCILDPCRGTGMPRRRVLFSLILSWEGEESAEILNRSPLRGLLDSPHECDPIEPE